MKKIIISFLILIANNSFSQTKMFTGFITSLTCVDFCEITLQPNMDDPEGIQSLRLVFLEDGKTLQINEGAGDLLVLKDENYELNEKYQGKKFTLTCRRQGQAYLVEKLEPEVKKPEYATAAARVYQKGELVAIAEGTKLYKINQQDGTKWAERTIQLKNELCKGTSCVRVVIDASGYIKLYNLPNTTDARIIGKFVGNKVYRLQSDNRTIMENKYVTFKGDKQKVALMIVQFDWFR